MKGKVSITVYNFYWQWW